MSQRKARCEVRDGRFVEPCPLLSQAANSGSYTKASKGVFYCVLSKVDERPSRPSRTFMIIKSGDFTARGIAVNFCPFCGEQIDAPFNSDDQQPSGGER